MGREDSPSGDSLARATLQVLLLVLGVAVALWVLYRLRGILLLLFLAVLFAYLVAPLVGAVHRTVTIRGRKIAVPRLAAIGAVYLLIAGSLAMILILVLPLFSDQLGELAREAPGYLARAQDRWQAWRTGFQSRALPQEMRDAIDAAIHQVLTSGGTYLTNDLLPRIGGLLAYLPWLVLVPILAFFLLKDADVLRKNTLRFLPPGRLRSRGSVLLVELNDTLAAYIRAQVTACLLIGIVCTTGFLVLELPYAVVFGIAAGLLEFIPLAGPLTIAVLAVTVAAFHSFGQALAVGIFLAVLRVVQDYVMYPRIVGKGIHLNPFAIILAILCGGELGGLAGIFLAIPVVAVATVAYRHFQKHRAAALEDESA